MERRDELLGRFLAVREKTRALAAPLAIEDLVVQSMADASPTKWHLAHTTWFFDTFIVLPADGAPVGTEGYQHLFNSYYNTVGEPFPRTLRGTLSRPTVEEVWSYRARVNEAVPRIIRRLSAESGAARATLLDSLEVGIHHEQQHQELMVTDIKHALGKNPLCPAYDAGLEAPAAAAVPLEMVRVGGGVHEIGHGGTSYAFDNERPRHRVFLEDFELASRPVSNQEFAAFIEDGGYERHALWLDDGWSRVQTEGWRAPLYWEERDGQWSHYTLGGHRAVDPNAPVCHVSHFEADAYARWAGMRLPTEAEWEVAAATSTPASRGTLQDDGALHPVGREASGPIRHLEGEVWEWTASAYLPYRGFAPLEGALGEYNGKFMSGQMVLRGGSCATPASHLRPSYRNFFQPEKRWQFSGFRLAR